MIREIGLLIEAQVAGLELGVNLFPGHLIQAAPDSAVLISEVGGSGDFYVPDKVLLTIQIRSRGLTYITARNLIDAVHGFLHGTAGWDLPTAGTGGPEYRLEFADCMSFPASIGQDEKMRFEFSGAYRLGIINKNGG